MLFWSALHTGEGRGVVRVKRWEGGEVGEVARWERWKRGKDGRVTSWEKWEFSGFIQGRGTQGESKTSYFCL